MPEILKDIKLNTGSGLLALYFAAALTASAVSFFLIFTFSKNVYREVGGQHDRHFELLSTASSLLSLDSSLTLAARQAVATGNPVYAASHGLLSKELNSAIKKINRYTPNPEGSVHTLEVNEANLQLIDLEARAIRLSRTGKKKEAEALLASREYVSLEKNYSVAVNELLREFEGSINSEGQAVRGMLFKISLVVTGSVIITLLFWALAAVSARRWLKLRGSSDVMLAMREAEYKHFFDSVQEIFYRVDWKGVISDITPSITRYSGYTREELIGKPVTDLYANPEDRKKVVAELLAKGMVEDREIRLKTRDRGVLDVLLNARLLRGVGGLPAGIEGSLRDITARKAVENELRRMNRLYAILSLVNEATMHLKDTRKLYQEICRIAVENGGVKFAWVGLAGPDGVIRPAAFYGEDGEYLKDLQITTDATMPEGRGPSGTSIRENKIVINSDTENNIFMLPWRRQALKCGFKSSATFPVAGAGMVTFYAGEVNFFTKEEERLLATLAENVTYAVNMLKTNLGNKA